MATKTLKLRIKDKHAAILRRWSASVNLVWNYCNELSSRSIKERHKSLSGYDLQQYTSGASKLVGLNAATVQMIGHEYVTRRKQFKKSRLAWRKTRGVRRSLGWIPYRHDCIQYRNGQIVHNGVHFGLWDSYGLSQYPLGAGSFSEDARGRWYFNTTVAVTETASAGTGAVGIDLGCRTAATTSDGDKLVGRWYRAEEQQLATAQRHGKRKRAKAISAKIANRRKDALHKFSRKLVNANAAIFVGNISSKAMLQTNNAKSASDAGWYALKTMLEYKSAHAGVVFEVVNERYSTQVCSSCGCISCNSPKGMDGLGISEWVCSECGDTHDRDINSAKNIREAGHGLLAGGIPHYSRSTV